MAYIRRRGCKCPKDAKRCTCGAKWSFTVDIGVDPVTGKRKQYTKSGFDTRRDAELAAAKVETEVASGTFVRETRATFEEYAQMWLKAYRANGTKPSSIWQREYQVGVLINCFGKIRIADISTKKYRETILDLSAKLSRNTMLGIHGVAKSIFRMALQDGDIKKDPTEFVKVPGAKKDDDEMEMPKYLEKEQLAEFLRLAKFRGLDNDYIMFLTLAYTGMRVGEACALKWSDIDFQGHTITINGTLYNPNDRSDWYQILPPKTKKARRTIDVDPGLIKELEYHKAVQNEFKMRYRNIYHDAGFVFARMDNPINHEPRYGYPMIRRTVELRMNRILQWMDLPFRATPHTLRHTHTSLLAEAGVSLEAIMERLGHKDDRLTRTVYLHVTKKLKKEASEKFSALMSDVVKM